MRLEWLKDIQAVIETGSLIKAADKRFLTQSAFSRRIKSIEKYLDVDLIDRSKKPIQLRDSVYHQQENIDLLAKSLEELIFELKRQDRKSQNRIIIVSQHAITTFTTASLINKLTESKDVSVRLRSANRDDCYSILLTKQADIALLFESKSTRLIDTESFLDCFSIGNEPLIPVFSSEKFKNINDDYKSGFIQTVQYPTDVFLGRTYRKEITPKMPAGIHIRKRAETALTLAALELAIEGIGVAWIPYSIAKSKVDTDELKDLSGLLPSTNLSKIAIRLSGIKSEIEDEFWSILKDTYTK